MPTQAEVQSRACKLFFLYKSRRSRKIALVRPIFAFSITHERSWTLHQLIIFAHTQKKSLLDPTCRRVQAMKKGRRAEGEAISHNIKWQQSLEIFKKRKFEERATFDCVCMADQCVYRWSITDFNIRPYILKTDMVITQFSPKMKFVFLVAESVSLRLFQWKQQVHTC